MKKQIYDVITALIAYLAVFILCGIITLLMGCKTKERVVTVVEFRTDTVWQSRMMRDSIYVKDSTYQHEYTRGDTVFVEVTRWNRVVRDVTKTDTTYISKTDSVPVPYPVEKKVPAELSWWQKLRMGIGSICLVAILIVVIAVVVKYGRKFKVLFGGVPP